jgi:hypothetical protein
VPHTGGSESSSQENWPTATSTDAESSARHGYMITGNSGTTLLDAVRIWTTPTVQDGHNNAGPAQQVRHTRSLNVQVAGWVEKPDVVLNPGFVEVLMGWPVGWTNPLTPAGPAVPFPPPPSGDWNQYLTKVPSAQPTIPRNKKPRGDMRSDRLRACGNGVVPQQATAAILELLTALGS